MEAKDFFGNKFEVGQIVVWPGRRSSSLWMNWGIVREITEYTKFNDTKYRLSVDRQPNNSYETERRVTIEQVDRVVIVYPKEWNNVQ